MVTKHNQDTKTNPKPQQTQRRGFIRIFGLIVAFLLVAYGVYGLLSWRQSVRLSQSSDAITKELNTLVTNSTDSPDESRINSEGKYKFSPNVPRRILLTTLGVEGFIQQVDIDQYNAVAVPSNIHFAGWYVNSSRPGDDGLSIINGHAQGKTDEAIFQYVKELKTGDHFEIEYGDLSKRAFEVASTSVYDSKDVMTQLFVHDQEIPKQLKLITCGGNLETRVIVSARPAK